MMKRFLLLALLVFSMHVSYAQKKNTEKKHYVCLQSTAIYHDRSNCAGLQMCGGRTRTIKDVGSIKPCPKCAAPIYRSMGFHDIKRVLGVKNKKQIKDSLGTAESTIHRPGGISIRISGPPESKTVNMLEFYFAEPLVFNEDTLFSNVFYDRLGLQFDGCKGDTIRSTQPHPVTGKVKKDVTVEYRGCAIVETRDAYEDKSRYYYELTFFAKETDRGTRLDKIVLILKVE
ncbi:MAG TPA: hypothetical protein VK589_21485 [Chryseolinea sp.]|nr:hypothetical protein [Chryseolinea sp.]